MDARTLIVPPLTPHASRLTLCAWRLRATFAGNLPPRSFITPDVRRTNPGWDSEVFNRQIEQLEFFLPTGHKILMSGMEAYNFFVEATQAFSRRGGARIEAFWLCGKLPSPATSDIRHPTSDIDMWRIGQGKVIRQRKPRGREWGGTPTRGWKLGLVGSEPVSCIARTE
jgi:hypothetical protein